MSNFADDDDELVQMYLMESKSMLVKLEIFILDADGKKYSGNIVDEIFRIMHSLKGASATMGYCNIATLTHSMEDVFQQIRTNQIKNPDYPKLTGIILKCKDFINEELIKIENGAKPDGKIEELTNEIKYILKEGEKADKNEPEKFEIDETDNKDIGEIIDADENKEKTRVFYTKIFFDEDGGMLNLRAMILINNVKESMNVRECIPYDLENPNNETLIINKGFQMIVETSLTHDEYKKFIENNTVCLKKLEINEIDTGEKKEKDISEKDNEVKHSNDRKILNDFISVNVAKLDKLMDITSEVIITEALLVQNPDLKGYEFENFEKVARQFRKITKELQEIVMDLRMLPLTPVFQKLKRTVHDVSEKLDKKIEMNMIGENTEVDKNIIEMLSDPLMHLVRNSIDHGIESKEERHLKRKGEAGVITLEARHVGGEVWISVIDDGGGLNKEKIYEKAVDLGLTEKPMNELTEREVCNFIFRAGFSTKDETTEFSGRGVGMDVVYKNIEKLHGNVNIDYTSKEGTSITLRIPLTLAIVDGMTVSVGKSKYTIPVESVKEIIALNAGNIILDTDGKEIINIRDNFYPMIRLHERFNIKNAKTNLQEGMALVVQTTANDVCIFADSLIGQQQIVVKPLPGYMRKINGVAGCSLLGDGTISLILDKDKLYC